LLRNLTSGSFLPYGYYEWSFSTRPRECQFPNLLFLKAFEFGILRAIPGAE